MKRRTMPQADRRTGVLLVIAAAIAWSTAPFFTRLLHYDSWTIIFWRGLFGGGFVALLLIVTQGRQGLRDLVAMKPSGWLVAALSTFGMVTFIPSLQLTSVANVAIIIAFQPFAAAAIAWLWLREKASPRTMVASLVALSGIGVIVGGATGSADYRGIGLACLMILSISVMTVAIRRHRDTSMVAAASVSNFLGSLVSIPFAQGITAVTPADLGILAMFGLFQVGLGLTFFTIGSRHLPAAQSSLIGMVETPLMAFWVYLGFGEVPSQRALLGGALVMGAVVFDILADTRAHRDDAGAKAISAGE
jgi:drug/metabolite transporter (DMT)-like permease